LYQILTRKFSAGEDPLTTLFYTAIIGCVTLSLAVPFLWITPSSVHLGLFLLSGTAGALGTFS
jgi:fluoride ion exporter CrcB/FEX